MVQPWGAARNAATRKLLSIPTIHDRISIMGEATDKLKAAGNKLAGNVKEGIGKATDNASLEAEGKAQKLKGSAQDVKGSVKGTLGDDI